MNDLREKIRYIVYSKFPLRAFKMEDLNEGIDQFLSLFQEENKKVVEMIEGDIMNILQKLHKIEELKNIYDIHYCRAGIGFIFYEPPKGFETNLQYDDWKKYLTVDKYYDTFEEAVKSEYKKMIKEKEEVGKSKQKD